MRIIGKYAKYKPVIIDPFCGRGTTVYAARRFGLVSYGLDTSPIGAAIAQAKLASATIGDVLALCESYLAVAPKHIPNTRFFGRAFSNETLRQLCSLREGLLRERRNSNASAILRAAALGCLHGPAVGKGGIPSYFSNQMPRTFATKPDYSLRYWRERDLLPPAADVMQVIKKKLDRISDLDSDTSGRIYNVRCRDARKVSSYSDIEKFSLAITSPPYYGMRTYVQDQWLRMWFLGGPAHVEYQNDHQICHTGQKVFISDLSRVWRNLRKYAKPNAHLYIRFGAIPSVKCDAKQLMIASLGESEGWRLVSIRNAYSSEAGKRQADQMGGESEAADEFDFHAIRN